MEINEKGLLTSKFLVMLRTIGALLDCRQVVHGAAPAAAAAAPASAAPATAAPAAAALARALAAPRRHHRFVVPLPLDV